MPKKWLRDMALTADNAEDHDNSRTLGPADEGDVALVHSSVPVILRIVASVYGEDHRKNSVMTIHSSSH